MRVLKISTEEGRLTLILLFGRLRSLSRKPDTNEKILVVSWAVLGGMGGE